MKDVISSILAHADAFRWVALLVVVWAFYRVVKNTQGIEFADFIAAQRDGKYYGDPAKLGQTLGVAVSVFTIIMTIPMAYKDFSGFSLVLGMCLGFLGGTYAWGVNVKSRSGQTVTVTEPAQPTGPTKTTVTTPAPSKDTPMPVEIVGGAGVEGEPLKVKEEKGK